MTTSHSFDQKLSATTLVRPNGLLSLFFVLAACSSGPSVTQVALTGPATLAAGLSAQMTATATYSDGSVQDVTSSVTWASDNAASLTVSNDASSKGLIKAAAVGTAHLQATLDNQSGAAVITVSAAELDTLVVAADNTSLALGTMVQLTATGTYSDGSTQDLTAAVQWSSTDLSIVQVSSDSGSIGLVTALAEGTVSVSATYGNMTANVQLTVVDPLLVSLEISAPPTSLNVGDTLQLSSTGSYTDDSTADVTTATLWTSSDPNLLSITSGADSYGFATANASGTVTVTGTLGNETASVTIIIN